MTAIVTLPQVFQNISKELQIYFINKNVLTHFMPRASFEPPENIRKLEVFYAFRRYRKRPVT